MDHDEINVPNKKLTELVAILKQYKEHMNENYAALQAAKMKTAKIIDANKKKKKRISDLEKKLKESLQVAEEAKTELSMVS